MDIVGTAIIAVINAGIGEPVKDAYNALKWTLQNKFGKDIVGAVEILEKNPDSMLLQDTIQKAIEEAKVQEDGELKQLAEVLLEKLQETPEAREAVKRYKITGDVGVADNHVNYKISNFKEHPNFSKKFMFFAALLLLTDAILFSIFIYNHYSGLEREFPFTQLFLLLIINIFGFSFGSFRLRNVKCPSCGQKTKTIENEDANMWQAYCPKCKITWSLGLSLN